MSKRRKSGIQQKLREGRGQGERAEYKPWINVRDVPSRGNSSRTKGWKTGRVHHFLSNHEKHYFLILEWSPLVVDIREQYPLLPIEDTIRIANDLEVRHPSVANKPVVMTTDFYITIEIEGKRTDKARTIKEAAQLQDPRVLQKLEIERRYWEEQGIDWGIVTERELPQDLVSNIALIHPHRYKLEESPFSRREIYAAAVLMSRLVVESPQALKHVALDCDNQLGLDPGSCLAIAYFLIGNRYWIVDMSKSFHPSKLLELKQADLTRLKEACGV